MTLCAGKGYKVQVARARQRVSSLGREDMATITIDDFAKVQMRVALVKEAVQHPNADRLVVMKLDVDQGEERQIVAGLRKWYEPQELVGKNIVLVENLPPVKLRGVESNGMLLAAEDSESGDVVILTVDRPIKPGSPIK